MIAAEGFNINITSSRTGYEMQTGNFNNLAFCTEKQLNYKPFVKDVSLSVSVSNHFKMAASFISILSLPAEPCSPSARLISLLQNNCRQPCFGIILMMAIEAVGHCKSKICSFSSLQVGMENGEHHEMQWLFLNYKQCVASLQQTKFILHILLMSFHVYFLG